MLSNFKQLKSDVEKYDTRSRTSFTSQRSNLSQSHRIKRLEQFRIDLTEKERTLFKLMTISQVINVIAMVLSTIYLSWWSPLLFIPLIMVARKYEQCEGIESAEKLLKSNTRKI